VARIRTITLLEFGDVEVPGPDRPMIGYEAERLPLDPTTVIALEDKWSPAGVMAADDADELETPDYLRRLSWIARDGATAGLLHQAGQGKLIRPVVLRSILSPPE
jgi:hypothetical protein